jgi:hypothetical protein
MTALNQFIIIFLFTLYTETLTASKTGESESEKLSGSEKL